MKRCSKCHRVLPIDSFYRRSNRKDGHNSSCKACDAIYGKGYRAANLEKCRQRVANYTATHPEQKRRHRKKYYATHREDVCQRRKVYYANHREQIHQSHETYRIAHREQANKRNTIYRIANREQLLQYARAYHAIHPEYARRSYTTRRARLKNALEVEVIDLEVLAERDNWRCHLCHKNVTRRTWSHDHLIPLSQGGSHTYLNVALAHLLCNIRRGVGRLNVQLRLLP
jgi:hypothetical protein